MIGAFRNDPFLMVAEAFKNLYPDKEYEAYLEPYIRLEENGHTVYGLTDFGDDGVVTVFVTPHITVNDAIEIFAHELAHVAVGPEHEHDEVWMAAFDGIFVEYTRIGDELFGMQEGTVSKMETVEPTEEPVLCKDCEYLMFSDCYGECIKAYKGIVNPNDSCGKGVRAKQKEDA